jgi:hypothetical protein
MKRLIACFILSFGILCNHTIISAQISVTLNIGNEPQQTFKAFGWTISPRENPYMQGIVTDEILDEFGKVIFEDLNTNVVRLWYGGYNEAAFNLAYIESGFLDEARKHGVKYFLLAPGIPDSFTRNGYLSNVPAFAGFFAKKIREFSGKYQVRFDATGIINEPGAGGNNNVRDEDYTTLIKTVRDSLDQNDLENVQLIALEHWSPTDPNALPFAQAIASDPEASEALDGYATHSYGFAIDRPHAQIALDQGWEYWMTEAGGAKSGTDISARFLNDLNNAVTHWVFFFGPAPDTTKHSLAAPVNGEILKSFHYFPLQLISKNFIPGTEIRHVTSTLDGHMIYKRTDYPGMNAAAGIRPDGKWVIGLSNITDSIHDKTAADYDLSINIPELQNEDSLQFKICRTKDQSDFVQCNEISRFYQGQGNLTIRSGEVVILTALKSTEPLKEITSSRLSTILWPDIPDSLKNTMGWKGDTIPGFTPEKSIYTVQLPFGTKKIPVLYPVPRDVNAKIKISHATSLYDGDEEKKTVFSVTSGDGSSTLIYEIYFEVQGNSDAIQPFKAEPIISQLVMRAKNSSSFIEIANPGNQPVDLKNYLFVTARNKSPEGAILQYSDTTSTSFTNRYTKYAPGYMFANDIAEWHSRPGYLMEDTTTNAVVEGGDVFVIGGIPEEGDRWDQQPMPQWYETDVILSPYRENEWGVKLPMWTENLFCDWNMWRHAGFLFKIVNDSVKNGLKPILDPDDFELIDNYGSWNDSVWSFAGIEPDIHANMPREYSFTRKENIRHGNIGNGTSMGTNPEDSEWIVRKKGMEPAGWTQAGFWVAEGIGDHNPVQSKFHISTIYSEDYIISSGYSGLQYVEGVDVNVNVEEFYSHLMKEDPGQTLEVHSSSDGTVRALSDTVENYDTLYVTSANQDNFTKYLIHVQEGGLSSDAVLISSVYTINTSETESKGTISGMKYGIPVTEILENINTPETALLYLTDQVGTYLPLKKLNYNFQPVNTSVKDSMFFKVIAQDKKTVINYQLVPDVSATDAFVISDVYDVNTEKLFIRYIPVGTNVSTFLNNVTPAPGADLTLIDTLGFQRNSGKIALNNKLRVISADGNDTVTYALIPCETVIWSEVYIISKGTEGLQKIIGVDVNTNFEQFINNIIIADPNLDVEIHSNSDGSILASGDIISENDTLTVNTDAIVIKYLIKIQEGGLDSDAVLTSGIYVINTIESESLGTIKEVEFGESIEEVISNINVPLTASLYALDRNYDPVSLNKSVHDSIIFLVISQDRKYRIMYEIQTNSSSGEAKVISDVYMVNQDFSMISLIPEATSVSIFYNNLIPVPGASLQLMDVNNNPVNEGTIKTGYKLKVISEDQSMERLYQLWINGEEAYVTSDSLLVDQHNLIISGIPMSQDVNEFINLINPAPGATLKVVDKMIRSRNSGPLEEGDLLWVISSNGKNLVEYSLDFFITGISYSDDKISVYPNPVTGYVYIRGLKPNQRIQIINALGNIVIESAAKEKVSVGYLPAGLYIVLIKDNNQHMNFYQKIMKK